MTEIGVRHRPGWVAPGDGRPNHSHDGCGTCRREDRPHRLSPLLGFFELPARRYCALLRHPLGARTMGASATADRRAAQTRCPCMRRCSPSYACRRFARVQSAICGRITLVLFRTRRWDECSRLKEGLRHRVRKSRQKEAAGAADAGVMQIEWSERGV